MASIPIAAVIALKVEPGANPTAKRAKNGFNGSLAYSSYFFCDIPKINSFGSYEGELTTAVNSPVLGAVTTVAPGKLSKESKACF